MRTNIGWASGLPLWWRYMRFFLAQRGEGFHFYGGRTGLWRTLMSLRRKAMEKSGSKAGTRPMAMAASAAKRVVPVKKAVVKKPSPAKKPAAAKKSAPAKKAPAKKPAASAAKPVPAPPRLATPLPTGGQPSKPAVPVAKPAPAATVAPRPVAMSAQSVDERRKAATRRFFARLRSLEAIVGADLRKRGSLVLMQAVDQWYSEAISATATEQSIANAAKAVIAHL
jgi:hypothetical protein